VDFIGNGDLLINNFLICEFQENKFNEKFKNSEIEITFIPAFLPTRNDGRDGARQYFAHRFESHPPSWFELATHSSLGKVQEDEQSAFRIGNSSRQFRREHDNSKAVHV
jgi:hypothetical protein